MAQPRTGYFNARYYYEKTTVTTDGSGDGTSTVTFNTAFLRTPAVAVVTPDGDSGTFTAASVSKTGFTLTLSGSDVVSADQEVIWFAHEKVGG